MNPQYIRKIDGIKLVEVRIWRIDPIYSLVLPKNSCSHSLTAWEAFLRSTRFLGSFWQGKQFINKTNLFLSDIPQLQILFVDKFPSSLEVFGNGTLNVPPSYPSIYRLYLIELFLSKEKVVLPETITMAYSKDFSSYFTSIKYLHSSAHTFWNYVLSGSHNSIVKA